MTAKPSYEELERRIQELEKADNVRNKIEKELQKSEARHSKMAANIGDVVVIIDQKGINRYKSPNIEKIFGWKPEEVVGASTWENVHPDDIESTQQFFEKIMHTPDAVGTMECRYRCKDGSYKWIEFSGSNLFHDPDIQGLLGNYQDITDRKQAEEMLKASEAAVRNKLKAIVDPEIDLGELELTDIIDVPAVQSLMENFHLITGMLSAIVDSNGKVLVDVGWQDICTKFHRCHPETQKNCVESDTALARITEPGRIKSFRCKNGLWDMSSPIVVSGRHMGNIYFGQFIYSDEQLDVERFCNQARQYGFDEAEYLAALNRVPRYDRKTVGEVMAFYSKLGVMISALSFSNIKLSRTLTEQKRAEESSKRLKERLESLWNITKIADSDIKTIRDHVLAEVQKMTQSEYAFYGFLDKNENEMILHAWSDQTMDDCRTNEPPLHFAIDKAGIWAQAVKEKKTLIINDFHLDHPGKKGLPDGHVKLTRLMAVPLIKQGKVISIAAVANKSDPFSKEDEKQVQAFLSNVQLLIDRKTAEQDKIDLMTRIQQLQKMESIGNLAGGIAHDFNNLLFPIVGLSEMMLNDFPPDSVESQNIREILNAGNRGRELVQQILSFNRQSEHQPIPVHIQKILKEALRLCRATIPADITITQDIQTVCRPVMADPTQMHQVAINLITNAYHAVESTGGTIIVQLKETDFIGDDNPVLHLEPGPCAVLTVYDTGTGIDPAIMNKIFDPYFTTKEKGRGTGLGLATVYGIVKTHGGDIRVHSEMGRGSCFQVYLPVLEKSAEVAPEKKQQPLPTGTEHILLVDDEAPIVHMEQQMLERLGYRITSFFSSADALTAFRTDPSCFDLIITDMNMPNLNGMHLAEQLTAIRFDIPIIICTGFSERINKENPAARGVKGLLMKPVVMKDLAEKIRDVLDDSRS